MNNSQASEFPNNIDDEMLPEYDFDYSKGSVYEKQPFL